MSALQRLLGRDRKFFDLLSASAAEARAGTQRLISLVEQLGKGGAEALLVEISRKRVAHKQISNEITEALCKQFYTPLEREDIEQLSDALYKISKTVEKVAERMSISPSMQSLTTVQRQLALLVRGGELVEKMVTHLCAGGHGETVMEEYAQLQAIESEADRAMMDLLRSLYRDESDGRVIIAWKDVYDLFEKAVDRCRDAGFVVFHVALKNA